MLTKSPQGCTPSVQRHAYQDYKAAVTKSKTSWFPINVITSHGRFHKDLSTSSAKAHHMDFIHRMMLRNLKKKNSFRGQWTDPVPRHVVSYLHYFYNTSPWHYWSYTAKVCLSHCDSEPNDGKQRPDILRLNVSIENFIYKCFIQIYYMYWMCLFDLMWGFQVRIWHYWNERAVQQQQTVIVAMHTLSNWWNLV